MRNNFNLWHQVVPFTESDEIVKGIIENQLHLKFLMRAIGYINRIMVNYTNGFLVEYRTNTTYFSIQIDFEYSKGLFVDSKII